MQEGNFCSAEIYTLNSPTLLSRAHILSLKRFPIRNLDSCAWARRGNKDALALLPSKDALQDEGGPQRLVERYDLQAVLASGANHDS